MFDFEKSTNFQTDFKLPLLPFFVLDVLRNPRLSVDMRSVYWWWKSGRLAVPISRASTTLCICICVLVYLCICVCIFVFMTHRPSPSPLHPWLCIFVFVYLCISICDRQAIPISLASTALECQHFLDWCLEFEEKSSNLPFCGFATLGKPAPVLSHTKLHWDFKS